MIVAIDLNPIDNVIDGVEGAIGGAAEAAGQAALDAVVKFVFDLIANAIASITRSIVTAMDANTRVDFDGGFFPALTPIRRTVLGMSTALVLALFFGPLLFRVLKDLHDALERVAIRHKDTIGIINGILFDFYII